MNQRDIIFLIISTFIVTVAWIILSVYHNLKTSTISQSTAVAISDISPSFDTKTITALKSKLKVDPIYSVASTSSLVVIPTPTVVLLSPAPTSTATPSGIPISSGGSQ